MSKKQITFDLDTKALQRYYPHGDWHNAYYDIKNYMTKNDFTWIQGSCYISNKGITSYHVNTLVSKLIEKEPWLNICVRDCRQTNINKKYHNMNSLFDKGYITKCNENQLNECKAFVEKVLEKYDLNNDINLVLNSDLNYEGNEL